MIRRSIEDFVRIRLEQFPCVAILGPRQVGKTTLAQSIVAQRGPEQAVYLDLENPADRRRLDDPRAFLDTQDGKLVVLDEIHRTPEIFTVLRGVIDDRRRKGQRAGHFLILGSVALDLLKQSSESLAGRMTHIEMPPFQPQDLPSADPAALETLWVRGGFPDSFLAPTDDVSFAWRQAFIRSYLERDIPQFGLRIPAETLERFWTMLAHTQGGLLNAQRLASSLGVNWHTAQHYLDLMVDLLLVRRLQPWARNTGKRLIKSPKIYVRDPGLLHTLLNIPTAYDLLGHPVAGASWEGYAIEALIAAAPPTARAYFYRTATGIELDLVLELSASRRWVFECKRSTAPQLRKGFHLACQDVEAERRMLVYAGSVSYPGAGGVEVMPLLDAVKAVRTQSTQI
ncbi:MAG TPA: ATP-binding protein [Gemmatimonadaceae bacterium]|jgi:predicted AAA+ superfamily ATPase|nr:ATP-binding protein [Gemmatimonadaceae bacterium]